LAVLLPNGTVYNPGGLSGAATAHAALSDSSNTSYVEHAPEWQPGIYEVGTYTKTAGNVVKHVRAIVKASSISVNPVKIRWGFQLGGVNYGETSNLQIAGTTPTVYNGPWVNVGDLSQASIDALRVYIDAQPLWTVARFYEASIEVLEASPPTTALTSPTGAVASSSFPITWTHTPGTEGGPQSAWQIKIFSLSQYGAEGFNVDTTPGLYDSGLYPDTRTSLDGYLAAGSYRVYARTAQSINGTHQVAAWDYEDITVGAAWTGSDYSGVLEVTAAGDGTIGAAEIIVDIDPATESADHIELQRSWDVNVIGDIGKFEQGSTGGVATGWEVTTPIGTPTSTSADVLNTPSPWDGYYQRVGATLDDGDRHGFATVDVYPINPGDMIRFESMIHAGLGSNAGARMVVRYYDAAQTFAAADNYDFLAISAWLPYAAEFTAPTGAHYFDVAFEIFGETGASGAVCLIAFDNVHISVNGDGWQDVLGADEAAVSGDQATVVDHLAPPDEELRYRARAVTAAGTVSNYVYATASTSWTSTDWFLKHPTDPSKTVSIGCLVTRPTLEQERPTGVFVVAGSNTPMVLYDELQDPTGELVFETETVAEKDDLIALLTATGVVAAHFPEVYDIPNMWVSIPRFRPEFDSQVIEHYRRVWTLPFIETREP
jgi:hypothetical protein